MSDYLPYDLFLKIMRQLSVKSLCRFKTVCKSWNNVFSCNLFANLILAEEDRPSRGVLLIGNQNNPFIATVQADHLISLNAPQFYFLHFPPITLPIEKIIGSVDGLVCLRDANKVLIVINPRTSSYLKVTADPSYSTNATAFGKCAFGYTIVRILGGLPSNLQRVRVLYLGTNQWETVHCNLDSWKFEVQFDCTGIYVGGNNCFWLGKRMTANQRPRYNPDWDSLVIFNLENRIFRSINLPWQLLNNHLQLELLHLRDNLGAVWDSQGKGSIFVVDLSRVDYMPVNFNAYPTGAEYKLISFITFRRVLMLQDLSRLSVYDLHLQEIEKQVQLNGSYGRLMGITFRDSLVDPSLPS